MNTVCKEKLGNDTFPVTMGVNAFRGFLDEFIREKKKPVEDKSRRKRHRRKKKKVGYLLCHKMLVHVFF